MPYNFAGYIPVQLEHSNHHLYICGKKSPLLKLFRVYHIAREVNEMAEKEIAKCLDVTASLVLASIQSGKFEAKDGQLVANFFG